MEAAMPKVKNPGEDNACALDTRQAPEPHSPRVQDAADAAVHAPSTTRLTCHAPHPDPRRRSDACGALMASVIGRYEFVGLVPRIPDAPDGYAYQRCPDKHCRAVNKFRVSEAS
jgi:hypothetical protein